MGQGWFTLLWKSQHLKWIKLCAFLNVEMHDSEVFDIIITQTELISAADGRLLNAVTSSKKVWSQIQKCSNAAHQ